MSCFPKKKKKNRESIIFWTLFVIQKSSKIFKYKIENNGKMLKELIMEIIDFSNFSYEKKISYFISDFPKIIIKMHFFD